MCTSSPKPPPPPAPPPPPPPVLEQEAPQTAAQTSGETLNKSAGGTKKYRTSLGIDSSTPSSSGLNIQ